jgi:hypothetical protein
MMLGFAAESGESEFTTYFKGGQSLVNKKKKEARNPRPK